MQTLLCVFLSAVVAEPAVHKGIPPLVRRDA